MLPLRDNVPTRSFPVVTVGLIVANFVVWFWELGGRGVDYHVHPDGYLRALTLLGEGLRPHEVIVFEDSEVGVASAKAAGMRCVAVLGTVEPNRLAQADELVPAIDVPLMRRLLGCRG